MKRISHSICCLVLFLVSFSGAFATHIVGGGFNMVNEGNNKYRIRLTIYFDQINGDPTAKDLKANFTIYRTVDNQLMRVIETALSSDSGRIQYQERNCGTNPQALKTQIFHYETLAELLPDEFDSPEGYYVVWERCCRNWAITNIENPSGKGQYFLMYFPPVHTNGQPFVNDSPLFKPVPSDIFCINQFSSIDFSATDVDGDSLAYDLTDPIGGDQTRPRPDTALPAPLHEPVVWLPGYDIDHQITGNPPLQINFQTGILTVRPNKTGLFVFAVRCQEFRNGVKIGEVRREFQQKVIDCPLNTAPTVTVRNPVKPQNLKDRDTLFITNNSLTPTCITVKVTDLQVGQRVTIKTQPLNFTPIAPITGDTTKLVTNSTDTVRLSFCLPACVGSTIENPWHMWIMAYDNGCSGSLFDTLDVFIVLTVPSALVPSLDLDPPFTSYELIGEDSLKINASTFVPPLVYNSIVASAFDRRNRPVPLYSLGMDFVDTNGNGNLTSPFSWKAPCVPVVNQPITLQFVTETTFCQQDIKLTRNVKVEVLDKIPVPQVLVKGADSSLKSYRISNQVSTAKQINLVAKVENHRRYVTLSTPLSEADLRANGIQFKGRSGISRIEAPLVWTPTCDFDRERFADGLLMVAASTTCKQTQVDSLRLFFDIPSTDFQMRDPFNLLTHNGDGRNDDLTINSFVVNIGCGNPFEGLELYDRWGKKTFETGDLNFVWPGTESRDAGVYFYLIRLKGKSYTGWLKVVE